MCIRAIVDRTQFCRPGTTIVTENADGRIYSIYAEKLQDILDDWNGNCNFVPANDARVFFATWNGSPISPFEYTDFVSLLRLLIHKEKAEEDSRASPSETSDWFVAYPGGSEYVNGEDARDIRIDELVSEEDIDPEDIHVFPANTELC